jgi:phosphoheptose isomerase
MDLIDHIQKSFHYAIELKKASIEKLTQPILDAGAILVKCISDGNKILSCGNGGSACDAQHFAAELVNRFLMERDNLPAIALTADTAVLTAIANDYSYQEVFAKQIKALGRENDVLLAISTSGKSQNVIRAIQEARTHKMHIVALTGGDSNVIKKLLNDDDVEIRVPSNITPHIQEIHVFVIHCLCDLIDKKLFDPNLKKVVWKDPIKKKI